MVNLKPVLCHAARTLRNQIDDAYGDRSRISDGWLGDARHIARGKNASDHNPDDNGWVRAIDISSGLRPNTDEMPYLADQLRIAAWKDKRIKYIIYNKKICSKKSLWRWRPYTGINPHIKHCHISFNESGDLDGRRFDVPLLGGKGE